MRRHGLTPIARQVAVIFAGRLATLGVEELILLVFVTWLACNALVVKVIAQVVVIVLNYVVSKYWVFGK